MALVSIPGTSRLYYPFDMRVVRRNNTQSEFTIDATGEKIALGGRVFVIGRDILDDGPFPIFHDLVRVGFEWGTIVKSGGSALTISLQFMDTQPSVDQPRPNETQSQTVAVTNGDSGFISNTWYRSGAFNSARQVQHNEKLCVVIEFDGAGRKGGDSVSILGRPAVDETLLTPWASRKLGGTWTPETAWPIILLEFDDGTYGTLEGSLVSAGDQLVTFNADSTPDEHGLRFTVPFTVCADGAIAWVQADASYDLVLYEGTTEIGSVSLPRYSTPTWLGIQEACFGEEIVLSAGVEYTIACKPTTSNNISLVYDTLGASAYQVLRGGTGQAHVARTNGGSWSIQATTQVPMLGVRLTGWGS